MKNNQKVEITLATDEHLKFCDSICQVIEESAKIRGTGIAKRKPAYIKQKIQDGKAVIAVVENDIFAGFCYIESWGKEKHFVANSGLIVNPKFRGLGLGNMIKKAAFDLSRKKFPDSKLFGITTSLAVMKINYHLGYRPVTFHQLTDDEEFWDGCKSCINFDILKRTNRLHCLCTAMLYDPIEKQNSQEKGKAEEKKVEAVS